MVRSRGEKDDLEKLGNNNNYYHHINNNHNHNHMKDASCRIMRVVLCLVIFVTGIVIGLISSSHIDVNWYYNNNRQNGVVKEKSIFVDDSIVVRNCTTVATATSIVKCETVDCLSLENLVKPREINHGLNDKELFWRASMVPRIAEYPFKRVNKVAFMFLTRGPLPFLPLWERFFAGHQEFFSIYVHTLPGFTLNVSPYSVFFGRQIPSQKVSWGDISLADAEKRLLANALLDFSNERFVLISESCIPVYNFQTVYKYITESVHSFVESYDDPSRYGRGRYSRRMGPDIKLRQWRKGSQWFEITRSWAIEIISDYKYYDLFRKYCHPSCYPDEHYIPTYLQIFHPLLNSNRTVTWVDWSLGGPHPASFGRENITEGFIQNIRNNGTECWYNFQRTPICYLFARKFDPSALEPLLNISSKVMGF
ncbi:glycosyltransferase BC10 [Beta vulgaris subsp. vulgaris]|uniref:glycosyltransferase BC10 n=1 Tax=Beta vulgaris subsp. vulgaris TaxID=3555 RepID=UPI00203718C8|nr:glycosyltransferase BC10 [Beta vulgaris subsp. vulgaris]